MKRSNVALTVARVGWKTLLVGVMACGQSPSGENPSPSGAVGFGLQLSPGVTVTQAVYTIAGPSGFFSAGNVAVGESAELVVPVGSLPLGEGYEIDLTAPASDGLTICNGKTLFDVTDGDPKSLGVHLTCAIPSGALAVTSTFNICPMIDGLGASPADVRLGGTIAVTSSAHDSDVGPSSLSYKWNINGASLRETQQPQPNLNFVCSQPGAFNFTLTVSDGDITPGCADTLSVIARCSAL